MQAIIRNILCPSIGFNKSAATANNKVVLNISNADRALMQLQCDCWDVIFTRFELRVYQSDS